MLHKTLVPFIFAAIAGTVCQAAEVMWYSAVSCGGSAQLDYKNVGCNTCVDPDLGMPFRLFSFLCL